MKGIQDRGVFFHLLFLVFGFGWWFVFRGQMIVDSEDIWMIAVLESMARAVWKGSFVLGGERGRGRGDMD